MCKKNGLALRVLQFSNINKSVNFWRKKWACFCKTTPSTLNTLLNDINRGGFRGGGGGGGRAPPKIGKNMIFFGVKS